MSARILVIDNYDSFTYNLVQYLGELHATVEVVRNDEIDLAGIAARQPDGIVLSPGPCTPKESGVSLEVAKEPPGGCPILGVCLGHQAIGEAFGGCVRRNRFIVHGKASQVFHDGKGVFEGLPSPFAAGRYHSLVVERASLPAALEVSAWTSRGEVMGLRHRDRPIEGVQFHPESVLTEHGHDLLANWLRGLPGRSAGARTPRRRRR
jgi:anthranilate synthase component 2